MWHWSSMVPPFKDTQKLSLCEPAVWLASSVLTTASHLCIKYRHSSINHCAIWSRGKLGQVVIECNKPWVTVCMNGRAALASCSMTVTCPCGSCITDGGQVVASPRGQKSPRSEFVVHRFSDPHTCFLSGQPGVKISPPVSLFTLSCISGPSYVTAHTGWINSIYSIYCGVRCWCCACWRAVTASWLTGTHG